VAVADKLLEAVSMLVFPPQTSHSILYLQVVSISQCLLAYVTGYTRGFVLAFASV